MVLTKNAGDKLIGKRTNKSILDELKDRHPSGKLIQNDFLTILVWFTF